MTNNKLISILGPTAIGKTKLSIRLAQHFDTEIISSDSRQFYKEMSIGTAVPSESELQSAKHHFIQHRSIFEDYNVGTFENEAINTLKTIYDVKDIAIMVGGSGLYTNAVLYGLDDFPEIDASIRKDLNSQLQSNGIRLLQEKLKDLDLKSYKTIAIDNPQRLIRALEVTMGTGKPYSSFLNKKKAVRDFIPIIVGLTAERSVIYKRINHRVDIMIENGLLEEAKALHQYKDLNALNTVGYKELFDYFEGNSTLDFAISEIKKNTRRFAKRQLTWYRKQNDIFWFDYEAPTKEIIKTIENEISK